MTNVSTSWPSGFAVNDRVAGPDPDVVKGFQGVPAAYVSDAIGRVSGALGLLGYGVGDGFCGPAVTVRTRPGDNLMIHKAFDYLEPGDVLVVDGGGSLAQALIGGNMRQILLNHGAAGVIIDGAIRDVAEFLGGGLPTLAKGVNHRGPAKDGPGEINVPISCAGMVVAPGDLIIADMDGAISIPRDDARAVLDDVRQVERNELASRGRIDANEVPVGRFDSILRSKGCPV